MIIDDKSSAELNRIAIKIYLLVAIPALFILSFLTGPFQVSDEPAHFLRAIALSHGQIAPAISASRDSAGGLVESSAKDLASKYGDTFDVALNEFYRFSPRDLIHSYNIYTSKKLVYAPFSNTAIYFPAAHLPQALSIYFSRVIGLKPLAWLYVGRLFNAGLFLIISCCAISLLRGFELFTISFLLLPMVLFESASLSADPLMISLSLLLCGLIKSLLEGRGLKITEYVLFSLCFLYVGLSKFAYIPICLIPFFVILLRGKFGIQLYVVLIMTLTAVLMWLAWVAAVHNDIFNMRGDGSYVDAVAQMKFIISHPMDFLSILIKSIRMDRKFVLETMVGSRLGWSDVVNPTWAFKLSWVLIVLSIFVRTEPFVGSIKNSAAIVFCAAMSFLMMYILLYLQFTPVGKTHIDGILGRYLLPLAALLPVIFGGVIISRKHAIVLIYGLSAVSVMPIGATMWTLLHRYWQV